MSSDSEASGLSEYIGYRLLIFVGVFVPLQTVAVVLRFWARSITRGRYGLDDWLVVACLLCQFVACGIAIGTFSTTVLYTARRLTETQVA
jgi:hypothetical protein